MLQLQRLHKHTCLMEYMHVNRAHVNFNVLTTGAYMYSTLHVCVRVHS